MTSSISRRSFIKQGGAMTAAVTSGLPFALNLLATEASAQSSSGVYKALVCVFLAGGNDAFNTVINTHADELARYNLMRSDIKVNNLAMTLSKTVNSVEQPLGVALNPHLPFVRQLFNAGNLAIIANIGPLMEPTTAQNVKNGDKPLPPKLYSHNDQQSVWQTGQPEGAAFGWGGEMARHAARNTVTAGENSANKIFEQDSQLLSAVSLDDVSVFCAGTASSLAGDNLLPVQPFGASRVAGALRIGGLGPEALDAKESSDPAALSLNYHWSRHTLLTPMFEGTVGRAEGVTSGSASTRHLIETDYVSKLNSANEAWRALSSALALSTIPKRDDDAPLKQQLKMVSQMIKARTQSSLAGMKRQVFFVQLGGFDTHDGEQSDHIDGTTGALALSNHSKLMVQLNEALQQFHTDLTANGDLDKVLTFTASEFGRKLHQNGKGCDHGWGGHSFVFGGLSKGGTILGQLPSLRTWVPPVNNTPGYYSDGQLLPDGTMVPKVAVENLMYSLGTWLGVTWTDSLKKQLLPTLAQTQDAQLVGLF
jgi:uncharacterized protein (DUF1501 family)